MNAVDLECSTVEANTHIKTVQIPAVYLETSWWLPVPGMKLL